MGQALRLDKRGQKTIFAGISFDSPAICVGGKRKPRIKALLDSLVSLINRGHEHV